MRQGSKGRSIFLGISSGASFGRGRKEDSGIPCQGRFLTFNYDTGERYLSIEGFLRRRFRRRATERREKEGSPPASFPPDAKCRKSSAEVKRAGYASGRNQQRKDEA